MVASVSCVHTGLKATLALCILFLLDLSPEKVSGGASTNERQFYMSMFSILFKDFRLS